VNVAADTAINGIMGTFLEYMTGDRFNPNERFGPGVKNPLIERLFNNEDSFIVTASGVAGSTVQDMTRLVFPVLAQIGARVGLLDNDIGFQDFREELDKVVSSLSTAERALAIINTGKYISKNEKLLTEVDNWKGYVNLFTGLQPDELAKAGSRQKYLNMIKTFQGNLEPRMLSLHRQMYDAGQSGDLTRMEELEKKLKVYYHMSGMTEQEISKFEYKAFQNMNKSWVEKVNHNLSKRDTYQYGRKLREEQQNNAR
jgi:hypothetical protein